MSRTFPLFREVLRTTSHCAFMVPAFLVPAFLVLALAPTGAQAVCVTSDNVKSELVWSLPARDATHVPIDTLIWVQYDHMEVRDVRLDGESVEYDEVGSGGLRIDPGQLEPDHHYRVDVRGVWKDQFRKLRFRFHTGSEESPRHAPTAALVATRFRSEDEVPMSELCTEFIHAQDCFDTVDTLLTLSMETDADTDVEAWLVAGESGKPVKIWPASCGHPTLMTSSPDRFSACLEVSAIGPGGRQGPAQRWCDPPMGGETSIVACEGADEPSTRNAVHKVEPQRTRIAWKARTTGRVVTRLALNADGTVDSVDLEDGLPMGLSAATVEALHDWRFEPAADGDSSPSTVCLETSF